MHGLGKWWKDFDPEPIYTGPNSGSEYMNFIFSGGEHGDWSDRFNARFQLIWVKQIETLVLKFGVEGIKDYHIGSLLGKQTDPSKRITEIRCRIACMSHCIDGLVLIPEEVSK